MFQGDPIQVERAKKLLKDQQFEALLHTAYNEFCWSHMPIAQDPQQSWAANARRQGARDFIDVLLSLADPAKRIERPKSGQLEREDARTPKPNPGN